LLGLSFPAEREEIESEFFANEDAFQEMLTTEIDLIDEYARGELAGEDRRRFENIFVNSLSGRKRVQFARALADTVATPHRVETKNQGALLDVFKSFRLPRLLPTATIWALIVFVAAIAWLIIDRQRMINELRELRSEFAELTKRTEALQPSSDSERTRNAEIAAKFEVLQAQPNRPRHRDRERTATQQPRHLPEVKVDHEMIASIEPESFVQLTPQHDDSTLGNNFVTRKITELPLEHSNVVGLLSLQPGASRDGGISGNRADQANLLLDGVDLNSPNIGSSGETIIRITNSQLWIRFQIPLETAATHDDYRLIVQTAYGRPVTSVSWSEARTPNQTLLVTPVISTSALPTGNYVLLLMGQESEDLFVKVAAYSFKVIKD